MTYNYGIKYFSPDDFDLRTYRLRLGFVITLQAMVITFNCFLMIYFGWMFIYQVVITIFYTSIYLIIVIYFDDNIQQQVIMLGFNKKNSRVMKFYLLYTIIGCLILTVVLNNGVPNVDDIDINWLANAILVS